MGKLNLDKLASGQPTQTKTASDDTPNRIKALRHVWGKHLDQRSEKSTLKEFEGYKLQVVDESGKAVASTKLTIRDQFDPFTSGSQGLNASGVLGINDIDFRVSCSLVVQGSKDPVSKDLAECVKKIKKAVDTRQSNAEIEKILKEYL
jgi:hypothetical protein